MRLQPKRIAFVGARLCYHAPPNQPDAIRTLGPKNSVPNFKGQAIVNAEMKTILYDDYKGKWLVFFFYPRDFTIYHLDDFAQPTLLNNGNLSDLIVNRIVTKDLLG